MLKIHQAKRGRPGTRVVATRGPKPIATRSRPRAAEAELSASPTDDRDVAGPVDHRLLHPLIPDTDAYELDVTIIVPTMDRPALLRRAVASVHAAAEHADVSYEVIIVDGGDPGAKDVRPWAIREPHVVYLTDLWRTGAVAAVNHGFSRARGRYTTVLNDDSRFRPDALLAAVARLADPMIGQVAMEYLEGGGWKLQPMFGLWTYANFGLVRTNVARAAAKISGGLWASHYQTYGGDVELSCWVRRLGYQIATVPRAVEHDYCEDDLRRRNEAEDHAHHDLHRRWTDPEQATFRGPAPHVSAPEVQHLREIERGEDRAARLARIPLADPRPGELPPTAPVRPERVVAACIVTPDDPQASLHTALRKLGSGGYASVDWLALPNPEARAQTIVDACRRTQPTFVFLQVQGGANLPLDIGRRIREVVDDPSLVIATWNGDVIPAQEIFPDLAPAPWELELSRHVDLMLFSGTGQVAIMRDRGMANAAYLQIGYDVDRYYQDASTPRTEDAVFIGQNYVDDLRVMPGQGVDERRELVRRFLDSGLRFRGYGPGWNDPRIKPLPQIQAGDVLRRSRLAVIVSATSALARYSSDRLFRAAACGAVPLVRRFDDIEGLGFVDGETCLVFDTPTQAVEIARQWLGRPGELAEIGRRAAEVAATHHTWEGRRLEELSAILHAIRGIRFPPSPPSMQKSKAARV